MTSRSRTRSPTLPTAATATGWYQERWIPTMINIQILDMTPVGYYGDGSPRYSFSCGFPTRGVRTCRTVRATKELAFADAVQALGDYEKRDPYGNMGSVLGVKRQDTGFVGVYVTYHSNT